MIGMRQYRLLWPLVAGAVLLLTILALLLFRQDHFLLPAGVVALAAITALATAFARLRHTSQIESKHCTTKSEQTYRQLFEHAPMGIFELSATRNISAANQTAEKYLGYTTHELLNSNIDALIHCDDRQKFSAETDALAEGRKNRIDCELRFMSKSGQPLWVQLGVVATNENTAEPKTYLATINSIQALKRYESLLTANEKKFRTITNSIESVVWMSTPGVGRILYINGAYEKIWGCSCDSLYANPHSFLDAVHPEDRARVEDQLVQHASGHWHTKYRIIRPDGELRFIRDTGCAVYDDDGSLQYMIGTAVDITLEVTLQNRMRETVNQLQTANDKLEQMIKIDPLTQCFTRQVLMEEMEKELSRFKRYGTTATLVFVDLNRFKDINDTWGHTVGDAALRAAAEMIRRQIRETDLLARYAGDEFILLLKQTDHDAAQAVVDKLRATPIMLPEPEHRNIDVTASYGIAAASTDTPTPTAWIHRADKAMYKQKRD